MLKSRLTFVSPTITVRQTSSAFQQQTSNPLKHRAGRAKCAKVVHRRGAVKCIAAGNKPGPVRTALQKQEDGTTIPVEIYDVVVIGGGPAGLSLTASLGARGVSVLCADATLDKRWPNNYGTWIDDLEPLGLDDCVSHRWKKTSVHVHPDGRKTMCDRQYSRVDRVALKGRLLERCIQSRSVTVLRAKAQFVDTATNGDVSYITLESPDKEVVRAQRRNENGDLEEMGQVSEDGKSIHKVAATVVVDATGHELMFTRKEEGKTPGYQAAYGIECRVSSEGYAPFAKDEMLLMDFRDDHMQATPADRKQSLEQPTFLYVMPMDGDEGRRAFFEETSLVASPAMDFDQLKERLYKRLGYYGIEVEAVDDEEFCLIPMGGAMPLVRQRVVGFGGAASFVHPATGYMIGRALALAESAADIIAEEIKSGSGNSANEKAFRIWDRIWNTARQRQRDFFNFGGEYIASIDLAKTRDFFTAFFTLPKSQWADFLSFRMMRPLDRLQFGLGVFARTSNRVRLSLIADAISYGQWPLLRSVLPLYEVEEAESAQREKS